MFDSATFHFDTDHAETDLISPMCAGGLMAGTMVETESGWRRVELLTAGDRVQTLDGGLRGLRNVQHTPLDQPLGQGVNVVHVPAGTLDNCSDIDLLAEQRVLLDLPEAEERFDTPLVLVPAGALDGWRGISCRESMALSTAVSLLFDDEEIVFANTGVMLHCPTPELAESAAVSNFFTALNYNQSRYLLGLDAGRRFPQVVTLDDFRNRVA